MVMQLQKSMRQRLVLLVWLALVLSIGVTGDLIVDLVFEEQGQAVTVPLGSDEPDDAAEHILMPSERSQVSDTAVSISPGNLVLISAQAPCSSLSSACVMVRRDHPPPRSIPLSFLIPLRI